MNRRITLILLAASILGAALVAIVSVSKQKIYFSKYAFFKDPSEYLQNDINSYESLKKQSRVDAAAEVARENFRNPIRSMIPLIIAPGVLSTPYGHLVTSIPYLILFLFLSSLLVYQRYGNLNTTLAYIAFIVTLPVLYNTFYGFAAYWMDLHSSLLFVSTMLMLVFYSQQQEWRYAIGFGVLASLEVDGRYNNAVYLFIAGAPILLYILWKNRERWKTILLHYAVMAGLIVVLAGWFLIGHLADNMDYVNLGYAVNFSLVDSVKFFFHAVVVLMSVKVLLMLILLVVLFYALFYRSGLVRKREFFLSLWLAFANFLLLNILLRNGDHEPSNFYIIMPTLLFIIAPFTVTDAAPSKVRIMTGALVLTTLVFLALNVLDYRSLSAKPKSAEKEINESILGEMNTSGDTELTAMVGGFAVANLSLENYFNGRPQLSFGAIFGKYDVAWTYYYKTKDVEEIEHKFVSALDSLSGYALIFADSASINKYFDKSSRISKVDISRRMAFRSLSYFHSSKDWTERQRFKHPNYGALALYRRDVR